MLVVGPRCGDGGGDKGGTGDQQQKGPLFLLTPANGQAGVAKNSTFGWTTSEDATSFTFELSTASNFSSFVVQQAGLTQTSILPAATLADNTVYYWRVMAMNPGPATETSVVWSFTTGTPSMMFTGTMYGPLDSTPAYFGSINEATAAFTKISGEGLQGITGIEALTAEPFSTPWIMPPVS
jgi:hypothetical protein